MALRFHVPPSAELPIELARRIILADFEGGLWACRAKRQDDILIVVTDTEDSGYLTLPWVLPQGGELMLTTATLIQRDRPYQLSLELARGSMHRVTNELANWQLNDHVAPVEFLHRLDLAKHAFAEAATNQFGARAAELSRLALERALASTEEFAALVIESLIASDRNESQPLRACSLPASGATPRQPALFRKSFDTAVASFQWRDIEREPGVYDWRAVDRQLEWCQRQGLRSVAGPLIDLHPRKTPDWLYLFEDDREDVVKHALGFVEQVAKRCFGRLNLWYASSGLNSARSFGLSEESRLKLAAESIQIIRHLDRQTPVMIGFEQPWGEYLSRSTDDLSPLGFADILVRSNLGIAAIALELNFDVWPGGTVRRDAFEFLRKIDQWAQFQLPLIIIVTAPSAACNPDDSQEYRSTRVSVSPQTQSDLLSEILPLLRVHRTVQGVVWNQWSDAQDCVIPATGLIDLKGRAKPALAVWR